ncbi:efflux RND transporter periplasmic adaptor subunit [Pseudomaricurvus sp. HS19]|uniref:efflux RND transporter periplasmic adaptor subunit n=1 Tax=Pseudomaricurvus sp. HS19 TaxID=2692626 RepID=UPI00136CF1BB|nr:efflux RND transporter periplasmic adaptor subunit [Pseudomaricurvus sp. HS19]MYM65089.1 efflux RND transporter periplasmic adaptor subunit [Pseudomaricurvus sp. HS19]
MQKALPKQLVIALAVLGLCVALAVVIKLLQPQPRVHGAMPAPVIKVEAETLQPQTYEFMLSSFGTVQPRTASLLVAQVNGVIVEVNSAFRDGGFFSRGDVLLRIDSRDYAAAAKVAQASWIEAKLALEEEKARAEQAQIDWKRLGNDDAAPDLVLRKPQLAAAEAKVFSARANYEKAQLDLERTQIRAPYDGRVKTIHVDLGQFVSAGSQLADIFATDLLEIRLPLKNSELALINLPEDFRGMDDKTVKLPDVTIISELGPQQHWQGKIVRTEAAIDADTHQLYVIAQIENPFSADNNNRTPLKIGQYVTARLQGRQLADAIVIPTSSLYQGSFVYLVSNGLLQRREVEILFQNASETIIRSGLKTGDTVVTSPLGQVTSGTRVAIVNSGPEGAAIADLNNAAQAADSGAQTP